MMTVRKIFYYLCAGEVQEIDRIDNLEYFIKNMLGNINPLLLREKMTECKHLFNRDIENWKFTFIPMAQINFENTSCCNISVGFRFEATMKEEYALENLGHFDTKSTIFYNSFLVIMSTNVLNLERFFKKYENEIFYVDPITGKRDVYSDAFYKAESFYKAEAHTFLNMNDYVFSRAETHLDFYRTNSNNLTILFDVF